MKRANRINKHPFTWTLLLSSNFKNHTIRIDINIRQIISFLMVMLIISSIIFVYSRHQLEIDSSLKGYNNAKTFNYLQKYKISINLQRSNLLKQKLRTLRKKEFFMKGLLNLNYEKEKEYEADFFSYPEISIYRFSTQKGEYAQIYINNNPVVTYFDKEQNKSRNRAFITQRNLRAVMAKRIKNYKFQFKKQKNGDVIAYINHVEVFSVFMTDITSEQKTLTVAKNWMDNIKKELRLGTDIKEKKPLIPMLDKKYRKTSFLYKTINQNIEYPSHTSLELTYLSEPKVNNINKTLMLAKSEVEKFNLSTSQLKETIKKYKNRFFYTPSIPPVRGSYVLSPFGWRVHPILHAVKFHTGIDMPTWGKSPVYATAAGRVTKARWSGGYGNFIMIDHGYGFETAYGHNSKLLVKKGSYVKKGQIIAYSGMTGLAKGIHTHYEVRFFGRPINPANFLALDLFTASKNW